MAKIFLIVVVFGVVYYVVRAYVRSLADGDRSTSASMKGEDMVRCRHCGIHLPRSESFPVGDAFFCSEEHRRLHGS